VADSLGGGAHVAITDRMIRATAGDVNLYEEVERDPNATIEALIVVAVTAIASGLGFGLGNVLRGRPNDALLGLVSGVISGLVGWAVFAGVCYFIGTKLFNADATFEEVLRTLGYSYTPNIVRLVVFVPVFGGLLAFAAWIWSLYLGFIAIRAALDIDSGKTIATILLAFIPAAIIAGIISAPFVRF
jgi:hypothetical protein